jgi:hypothetical protein
MALVSNEARRGNPPAQKRYVPKHFHFDKRAAAIFVEGVELNGADLLTTSQMAKWFGVTEMWFGLGRKHGYGPRFERHGWLVFYRRSEALKWLWGRDHIYRRRQS